MEGATAARNQFGPGERAARSRLAQILYGHEVIHGSIVPMARACGKTGCRCTRGEKHTSLHLSAKVEIAFTDAVVRIGHGRWGVENQGFNELGNQWHGDHAYRYHAHALLACNLFHAFVGRNLKPAARAGRTRKYFADLEAAEFVKAFHRRAAPP